MNRRDVLRRLPAGAALGYTQLASRGVEGSEPQTPPTDRAATGRPPARPPLKITDIATILTAPNGIRLVIVKVSTSEPGLYGLGCATFTQRAYAVQTAVDKYLKPFLIGRDADEIEDIWQ